MSASFNTVHVNDFDGDEEKRGLKENDLQAKKRDKFVKNVYDNVK